VLLLVERAVDLVLEGFGKGQDGIEGGAQFMAHSSQKFIFEAGGAGQFGVGRAQFCRALRYPLRQGSPLFLQRLLRPLPLGDFLLRLLE